MDNISDIRHELKHLYYLSKVLCLAPFSFSWNPVAREIFINTSLSSNVTGFIWTLFMSIIMVTGLISGIIRYKHVGHSNPGVALNNSFCFPMNFINALLSFVVLFMNRFKFGELVQKLSEIDDKLCQIKLRRCTKYQNYFLYFAYTVCALLLMFMCYDILEVEERRYFVYSIVYRIAYFISLVLIIQFCHIVRCIEERLIVLERGVSSVLENRTPIGVTSTLTLPSVETVDKSELLSITSLISENENQVEPIENSLLFSRKALPHRKSYQLHIIITSRKIYSDIYDATQLINSVYGFILLLLFIRAAAGLVTNIYHLASITISGYVFVEYKNWGTAGHISSLVTWIVIFLSTITMMTVTCQMTILKSKKIGDIIQKLILQQPLRSDMLQQLKLFSDQVAKSEIKFSAFWFFNVDMSLLYTMLTSVTTYIIVLMQAK
ncbi:hypothetical protein L798_08344 [Zootermopsis nevadensis]|uniref:Gustatory receptor n=1 Tax=Zootermopsis nevadensis TaxID=136037 RepID=A0A067R3C3_ZOONE|nr:hypothetical protein L798_08344 [Zootermopsis nevadensis]